MSEMDPPLPPAPRPSASPPRPPAAAESVTEALALLLSIETLEMDPPLPPGIVVSASPAVAPAPEVMDATESGPDRTISEMLPPLPPAPLPPEALAPPPPVMENEVAGCEDTAEICDTEPPEPPLLI